MNTNFEKNERIIVKLEWEREKDIKIVFRII